LHLRELQTDLDAEPGDLDRERGRREDAVQEVGPVQERRVVQQERRADAVAIDRRAGTCVLGQLDELTRGVGVGLARRQPEQQLRERILERLPEHGADLLRRALVLAHRVLERAHLADGVVSRAAEAAVDRALDDTAERPEGECDCERRRGSHPGRAATGDHTEPDRHTAVRAGEEDCEHGVDERAVHEPLDRVQPIARHRHADRHRDGRLHQ
jgi:hypothetical protein